MSNAAAQYEKLIQEFCQATGIDDWSEVATSQHIRIGDQLIGLIVNAEDEAPILTIYVSLGQTYDQTDTELYGRMLEANFEATNESRGCYGLHPEGKQAVYIVRLGLEEMNGQELAGFLQSQLELSASTMDHLRRPD